MKTDRRVQRTRELLEKAFITLLRERPYDEITVQDVVNRANVGRTTFYLHYKNKDELLISCHRHIFSEFPFYPLSREELLSTELPERIRLAYQHLEDARALLSPIFQGYVKDSTLLLRQLRGATAQGIETHIREAFADADNTIPFDVLAHYLAGAQIGLVQWWLEKRRPHAPEDLAEVVYRCQRAVIREAFELKNTCTSIPMS